MTDLALLRLLNLVSPALPIGAYSYSEGLETLVESQTITTPKQLTHWLTQDLTYGAIRLEAAAMLRAYDAVIENQPEQIEYWNQWLSALRETAELRQSSWQMGRSLDQLFRNLEPDLAPHLAVLNPCNYAIAFGQVAAHWQIDRDSTLLGYLHSWLANSISAAVKLIPLGQTDGQKVLGELTTTVIQAKSEIGAIADAELACCSWGLGLASMNHETQYSRLFRS